MPGSTLTGRLGGRAGAGTLQDRYPRLRAGVLLVLLGFAMFCVLRLGAEPGANVVWAIAIAIVALLPAAAWASGMARGLPILPAHLAALLLTCAVPLVSGHPEIALASGEAIGVASFSVILYAVVATSAWLAVMLPYRPRARDFRVLPESWGYQLLVGLIVAGIVYNVLLVGNMITFSTGLYSVVRAMQIALTSIALFIVAIRLGSPGQSLAEKLLVGSIIAVFVLSQVATLYLGSAIFSTLAVIAGISIGGGRVPWAGVLAAVLVLGVLHAGKGPMRVEYWSGSGTGAIQAEELPGFFAEWVGAGLRQVSGDRDEGEASQPIYERMSLMHILLLAQSKDAGQASFLNGETYLLIPKLLLPRFIDPDKPSPHDATNLLSEHYGLQSIYDQESTMIGWGLIAEGYANFGLRGIAFVGAFMGLFLGMVTRFTVGAPVLSLSNFLGILVLVIAMQSELTMAVLVTAILQSTASLLLLLPFCKIQSGGADR